MKNRRKLAGFASVLFAFGMFLAVVGYAAAGFSFSDLAGQRMIETVLEPTGEYENISLVVQAADVKFALSEDERTKIVCREAEKIRHYAQISENTLRIDSVDTRQWFDRIGINFGDVKITVYLPKSAYQNLFVCVTTGDVYVPAAFSFENVRIEGTTSDISMNAEVHEKLNLETTTGDIDAKGVKAKDVSVRLTTGDVRLSDILAEEVYVKTTTGRIELSNVLSGKRLECECTTGGIRFDGLDAGELVLTATTGSIRGTVLSEKEFDAKATTGAVRVPYSRAGSSICRVRTTTGHIDISIGG